MPTLRACPSPWDDYRLAPAHPAEKELDSLHQRRVAGHCMTGEEHGAGIRITAVDLDCPKAREPVQRSWVCNPTPQDAEAERLLVLGQSGPHPRPYANKINNKRYRKRMIMEGRCSGHTLDLLPQN